MTYFTDSISGLTENSARAMGVVLISQPYFIYKGNPIDIALFDSRVHELQHITTSAMNADEYRAFFAQFAPPEDMVYVCCESPLSYKSVIDANIPNLRVVQSHFWASGQIAVLERVMAGKPYDDIRFFIATKNPNPNARVFTNEWATFEMINGQFHRLATYRTRFGAKAALRKLVTGPIHTSRDFPYNLLVHLGSDCLHGVKSMV